MSLYEIRINGRSFFLSIAPFLATACLLAGLVFMPIAAFGLFTLISEIRQERLEMVGQFAEMRTALVLRADRVAKQGDDMLVMAGAVSKTLDKQITSARQELSHATTQVTANTKQEMAATREAITQTSDSTAQALQAVADKEPVINKPPDVIVPPPLIAPSIINTPPPAVQQEPPEYKQPHRSVWSKVFGIFHRHRSKHERPTSQSIHDHGRER